MVSPVLRAQRAWFVQLSCATFHAGVQKKLRSAELAPGRVLGSRGAWAGAGAVCLAGAARGHRGWVARLQPALASTTLCHQLPVAAQPAQVTACPVCWGSLQLSPSRTPGSAADGESSHLSSPGWHRLHVAVLSRFSETARGASRELGARPLLG